MKLPLDPGEKPPLVFGENPPLPPDEKLPLVPGANPPPVPAERLPVGGGAPPPNKLAPGGIDAPGDTGVGTPDVGAVGAGIGGSIERSGMGVIFAC